MVIPVRVVGISAFTKARNVGAAADPEEGPAKKVLAVSVLKKNVCVPAVVMVPGDAVM